MELSTVSHTSTDLPQSLEKQQLTALINSMADGVLATDESGAITLSNGAALNILDVNSSLSGQKLADILKLFDSNNQQVDVSTHILNTKTQLISRDWLIHYDDGSKVNIYLSASPVHLGFGSGGQTGFVILLRDITHEKSLEEERDEFISVISHELRTPVAIAEAGVSNAQLLAERQKISEPVIASLKSTHEQVVFLSNMINDLATLSRAERGKLEMQIEPINVAQLLENLHRDYQSQATAKKLKFECSIDPKLELLFSSRLYVKEVLQNFVTNAIKYTESGSVSIRAEAKQNGVSFEVSDSGIGISKADQEKIFDKFFRSEDFRTRANNGTGLGLYVTMKLARMLHSEIDVSSELNKGSTFSIFIPNLEQPKNAEAKTSANVAGHP